MVFGRFQNVQTIPVLLPGNVFEYVGTCIGRKSELDMRSCLMEMLGMLASFFPGDLLKVIEDMVTRANNHRIIVKLIECLLCPRCFS